MNCTEKSPALGPFGSRCCPQDCRSWGRKPRVSTEPCWVSCVTPGCSCAAAAARAEPHPQWGRRNNRGSSSGSQEQAAEPGVQSSVRCPGVEPSPAHLRELQGDAHRARAAHGGIPEPAGGSARALHPFTPWITTARLTSLLGKALAPGRHRRLLC